MKIAYKTTAHHMTKALLICLAASQTYQTAYAASTDLANVPMAVSNSVTPNILVILDNSESMDGYMNGTLVAGSDPNTRSNIGRAAMRNLAITPYRTAFNWGLMSFQLTNSALLTNTYVYYLGDAAGMAFTNSCSGYVAPTGTYPNQTPAIAGNTGVCTGVPAGNCGRSPANALWTQFSPTGGMWTWHDSPDTTATWTGNRCIANPQPQTTGTAYAYLTIDYSSDDLNINDVLYTGSYSNTASPYQIWAPADGNYAANTYPSSPAAGTYYDFWSSRSTAGMKDTTWFEPSDFTTSTFGGPSYLTPTDAGYLPNNTDVILPNDISRSLYLPRAWGYMNSSTSNAGVTGNGQLYEAVIADSTTHYNKLMTLLGSETNSATGEIKNAAEHTPTAGTLATALSYFKGTLSGQSTPVQYSCQQSFVMLVTDGLPTGTGGYSSAQLNNTCVWNTATNSCSTGSPSQAVQDVITQLTALRTTAVSGASCTGLPSTWLPSSECSTNPDGTGSITGKYDIQTYVVGLGDTVANANNFSALNAMAYNGGGMTTALLANNQPSFESAVVAMTNNVTDKVGSASNVAVATPLVTQTNDAAYASTYNSGTWAGDLGACPIDLISGKNDCPINPSTNKQYINLLWTAGSAQAQLDALSYPGGSYSPTNASTVRYIVTSVDATGVSPFIGGIPFQWASLSASQQALLNTPGVSPADGAAVLAYLRGDRTGEPATYRARAHLLGDIVDAAAAVVSAPSSTIHNYSDLGYQAFMTANAGRSGIVYQGSNDGMLHAFDALTGKELWAYIPNLVFGTPCTTVTAGNCTRPTTGTAANTATWATTASAKTATWPDATTAIWSFNTLSNLSSKSAFSHKYRVDGTPFTGDADFNNVTCLQPCTAEATADWHTILVGGLGKGGRGYYALDVTSSTSTSESAVAGKVLWEFPNSITNAATRATAILNTGYSFGRPLIVKTKAQGWVVLVTSGYNNGTNTGDSGGDGLGHLYVLNPKNGDLIMDIPTAGCNATPTTNPCGLAQLNAYVANSILDATTDYVYGGDLYGNVWRFDLSGSTAASWTVGNMAVLRDSSGTTQPITAAPELGTVTSGTTNYRYVYVGTGEYLGTTDVGTTQTQTMYGLIDPKTRAITDLLYTSSLPNWSLPPNTNVGAPLRSSLIQQTMTHNGSAAGSTSTNTNNAVDPAATNGWYVDLPTAGERVVNAPVLSNGALVFTSDIPSSVKCEPGGSSWTYTFDYSTGGGYTNPTTGVTSSGTSNGNVLASGVTIVVLPSGNHSALWTTSNGGSGSQSLGGASSAFPGKRVSWHELIQ